MIALVLFACGGPSPADQRAFTDALRLPGAAMVPACQQIGDDDLGGECLSQAGAALALTDLDAAGRACDAIAHPTWQMECWFLVTDAATLTGDAARQRCDRAGKFRERCRQHAAHRELAATARPTVVGQEAALRGLATTVVSAYNPELRGRDLERVVDAAMAQELAARWDPAPFRVTDCGVAGPHVCEMAYDSHVFEATKRSLDEKICQTGLSSVSVSTAGGLGWEGDGQIPTRMWRQACKRRREK